MADNENKESVKKKKILLLSDDLRMTSGIATMSRHMVMGTIHKYDWVQLASAIDHPDAGKILDLSSDINNRFNMKDANLKLYPHAGYGNPDVLRQLLMIERPDAILHFTDPRYWVWLYDMEHEVRQTCPIMYYTIWDDLPDPKYNAEFYASCDSLFCISKQTYGIVNRVLSERFGDELNLIKE